MLNQKRLKLVSIALMSSLALTFAACGGGGSSATGTAAMATAPAITAQPAAASAVVGQVATFTVSATGTAPMSYQWQKNATAISGATQSSYTTAAAATADNGAKFSVVITNAAGSVTSSAATLAVTATGGVTPVTPVATDMLTFKYDQGRTGQNRNESTLTLANVNSSSFGLLRSLAVDGKVDAQPLYLSKLAVGASSHNVVYVATENDSVYAFDADTGASLWHASMLAAGESTGGMPGGCAQVTPTIGVTSTPVIDRAAGTHGVIYVVSMSLDSSAGYHQRLHALDVTTGAELFGGPKEITATYPATAGGAATTFAPGQYEERAALLLANGVIYTSWTSHCDDAMYYGWIISYDEKTLAQKAALNVAPNSGGVGPSIWMSGSGPGADAAGNIYLLTANGVFETTLDANGFPNQMDFANSFLKLTAGTQTLTVADYFTMSNEVSESVADLDLASGGEMLLPDLTDSTNTVRHLMVGAGKDGNIYVVNRDSMGKFNASANQIWQELDGAVPGGIFASPAYFNNNVYYGDISGTLKAFGITNAKLSASPTSQSSTQFGYPGTSPAVSANGATNGIVWTVENASIAVLHAYDATNLAHELYNTNQAASGRDNFGAGNKFITPAIADGRVFVGTTASVAVFGLLH
ncbi:MAG TPA: PQQ-binding-like beta-propeller repeat protein [Steroidobacteraceae bacterium]